MADQSTIVVATNNPGKLKEFALLLPNYKIISQSSLGITPEEELGETFFENSLQKARVANAASGKLSLGDDSGLIVPALNNLPGLRSARYAHECATDEENRLFLKQELEKLELNHANAYFVCVLVLVKTSADYVLSERVNLQLFYDRIVKKYEVANSFDTANSSFGIKLRFSFGS